MTPTKHYVLSAVGPDRPGLVKEISGLLNGAGASIQDSRMAILGGEFAVIVLFSCRPEATEQIKQCAQELETKHELQCLIKETFLPSQRRDNLLFRLRVNGLDRPGIVQAITGILADHGVNVATFESRLSFAPMSGTPMFVLEADLLVPAQVGLAKLRTDLALRCQTDNLDFILDTKG